MSSLSVASVRDSFASVLLEISSLDRYHDAPGGVSGLEEEIDIGLNPAESSEGEWPNEGWMSISGG